MYTRVVVGWDGTEQARDALALAGALRAPEGNVMAVCVTPATGPGRGADLEEIMRSGAQRDAEVALAGLNLDWLETTAVAGNSAAQGLDAYAESTDADLIVVGSSHHGTLGAVLAGSVGQRLLHGAPCAVAVAPKGFRDAPPTPRVVGAAYDGSIESAHALVEARRYADSRGGSLHIVTAVPPLDVWASDSLYRPHHNPEEIVEYRRAEFERMLDDAAAPLSDEYAAKTTLVEGRAADAIVQEARKGIDLLFLGSRAYGGLRRAIAGGTAAEVLRRSPCPVVVLPRGSAVRAESHSSAAGGRDLTLPPADVVLRDGSTVCVRAVRPDDRDALLAFLEAMSPESRRLRFFSAAADLRGAARWASSVANRRGFGLVATTGDPPSIVAHAGYERIDDDRAEVAFEVADSLRGRGLGTLLMAHLAGAARDQGIGSFYADVLPENRRMLEVFQEAGFPAEIVRTREGIGVELTTELSLDALERFEERERIAASAAMRHFLEPASVAVAGASRRDSSVGAAVLESILRSGFDGPVYPVNPHADTVAGLQAYGSIGDLPEAPELVVVAVRAERVADVARDCAVRGVRALLVLSAGFAEAGAEGALLQDELVAVCRAAGMRLVGPNCLGLMGRRRPLDATFVPHAAPPGRVALLSQSGGVGLALIEQAAALGLGLSSFVSIGNRPDISANDVLEYWEDDDSTDVVLVYLESFGNPRNFVRIARRLARRKPIVALRAGRSGAGARAAASHTGAVVAASDAGIEALFGQAGIVQADTLGELFDIGALLASQGPPAGRRVAVVTNAGGPAILCADACEAGGLVLPEPSRELGARLAEHLPAHASTHNPVDMLAAAGTKEFDAVLRALADSGEVDALVALFTPALSATAVEVRNAIDAVARDVAVPVVAVVFGAGAENRDGEGAAQFSYPEGAARALSAAARLAEWRQAPPDEPPALEDARRGEATELLAAAVGDGERWLSDTETARLLEAWGVPLVETVRAVTPAEAGHAASALGGPVVLKAVGEGIVHKTDLGAVQTGLEGEEAVRRSAQGMSRRLRRRGLPPHGFLVQRYVTGGVEMLSGITVDPLLGPLVACAAGGTVVELIGDVSVRLAPIGPREAAEMVRSLSTFPLLDGYRGARPADVAALEDLVTRLGALAGAHPEIVELDCNPVMVLERGAVVVDARVRVAPPGPRLPWPSLGAEPPVVSSSHGPGRRDGAEAIAGPPS